MNMTYEYPKAPRWIVTEAGLWAWQEHADWRGNAATALSVYDRSRLLQEAEALRNTTVTNENHDRDGVQ